MVKFEPRYPTGKRLKRRRQDASPRVSQHARRTPVPTGGPKVLTKTQALDRIGNAGLDEKAFSKVLNSWFESGLVAKEGMQYLIPEDFVTKYILKVKGGSDNG